MFSVMGIWGWGCVLVGMVGAWADGGVGLFLWGGRLGRFIIPLGFLGAGVPGSGLVSEFKRGIKGVSYYFCFF